MYACRAYVGLYELMFVLGLVGLTYYVRVRVSLELHRMFKVGETGAS